MAAARAGPSVPASAIATTNGRADDGTEPAAAAGTSVIPASRARSRAAGVTTARGGTVTDRVPTGSRATMSSVTTRESMRGPTGTPDAEAGAAGFGPVAAVRGAVAGCRPASA